MAVVFVGLQAVFADGLVPKITAIHVVTETVDGPASVIVKRGYECEILTKPYPKIERVL